MKIYCPKWTLRPRNHFFAFLAPVGLEILANARAPCQTSKLRIAATGGGTVTIVVSMVTKVAPKKLASEEPPLDPELAAGTELGRKRCFWPNGVSGSLVYLAQATHWAFQTLTLRIDRACLGLWSPNPAHWVCIHCAVESGPGVIHPNFQCFMFLAVFGLRRALETCPSAQTPIPSSQSRIAAAGGRTIRNPAPANVVRDQCTGPTMPCQGRVNGRKRYQRGASQRGLGGDGGGFQTTVAHQTCQHWCKPRWGLRDPGSAARPLPSTLTHTHTHTHNPTPLPFLACRGWHQGPSWLACSPTRPRSRPKCSL